LPREHHGVGEAGGALGQTAHLVVGPRLARDGVEVERPGGPFVVDALPAEHLLEGRFEGGGAGGHLGRAADGAGQPFGEYAAGERSVAGGGDRVRQEVHEVVGAGDEAGGGVAAGGVFCVEGPLEGRVERRRVAGAEGLQSPPQVVVVARDVLDGGVEAHVGQLVDGPVGGGRGERAPALFEGLDDFEQRLGRADDEHHVRPRVQEHVDRLAVARRGGRRVVGVAVVDAHEGVAVRGVDHRRAVEGEPPPEGVGQVGAERVALVHDGRLDDGLAPRPHGLLVLLLELHERVDAARVGRRGAPDEPVVLEVGDGVARRRRREQQHAPRHRHLGRHRDDHPAEERPQDGGHLHVVGQVPRGAHPDVGLARVGAAHDHQRAALARRPGRGQLVLQLFEGEQEPVLVQPAERLGPPRDRREHADDDRVVARVVAQDVGALVRKQRDAPAVARAADRVGAVPRLTLSIAIASALGAVVVAAEVAAAGGRQREAEEGAREERTCRPL
jgi:hypothetical protein